jgi:hypothetical protein
MDEDIREPLHDPEEGGRVGLALPHIKDTQAELEHATPENN